LPPSLHNLLNFAAFQAGWFACALSAAGGVPWIGPAVVGGLLCAHVYLARERRAEVALLAAATIGGGAVDTAQWLLGVSIAPVEAIPRVLAPLWFATMYANFASTLRYSLAWLGRKPVLAAVFGAGGGPLAYGSGARLGAIDLADPAWRSLLVLGLVWAVLTPALFALERRMRGAAEVEPAAGA
jgi:hypothetical protein